MLQRSNNYLGNSFHLQQAITVTALMPRRISNVFCYLRTFGNERDSEELGSNMELGSKIKGILKSWGEFQPLIHYKAIKMNP